MTAEVIYGTVKQFNERARWGFIPPETGSLDSVFFHMGQGVGFDPGEHEPVGNGRPPARLPQVGDVVCFHISRGVGGKIRAEPWGLKDEWDEAWHKCAHPAAA